MNAFKLKQKLMRKEIKDKEYVWKKHLLAPTAHVVSYAGEIEFYKEEVRKNPDDALALLISAFSTVPGVWQLRGTQGISILED